MVGGGRCLVRQVPVWHILGLVFNAIMARDVSFVKDYGAVLVSTGLILLHKRFLFLVASLLVGKRRQGLVIVNLRFNLFDLVIVVANLVNENRGYWGDADGTPGNIRPRLEPNVGQTGVVIVEVLMGG